MPTVVKVGGSLLTNPNWPSVIEQWTQIDADDRYLVVVGGGDCVNAIRDLDRFHNTRFERNFLHWLCVDLLDTTFQIASHLLPVANPIHSRSQLRECLNSPLPKPPAQQIFLVRVNAFYFKDDQTEMHTRRDLSLPENWDTTTDSIAALLCHETQINRLVIWKSVNFDSNLSLEQLATSGVVDKAFPSIASGLDVEFKSLGPLDQ